MEQRASSQESRIGEAQEAAADARTAITEKLEVLEERVRETLQDTRSVVEDIVENVRGTVDDTVGTVKETVDQARSTVDSLVENVKDTVDSTATMVQQSFDIQYQMEQRPWLVLGGAVLAGYVIGAWTMPESARRQRDQYRSQGAYYDDDDNLYAAAMSSGATPEDIEEQREQAENGNAYAYPSHMPGTAQEHPPRTQTSEQRQPREHTLGQFHEEWEALKSVALGTVMGALQAVVRQQIPGLASQINNVLNRMAAKLGAEPIDLWADREHSQDRGQPETSTNYAAYAAQDERARGSTSMSQGVTDRPVAVSAQPHPYTQYRR